MSKMLLGVCLGVCFFVFSGCATMFQGSSQSIPIISNPVGAVVTVDGKQVGKTPYTLNLKRKKQATLLIQAEGYDPYMTILQRKRSGWFWTDILLGLTIWGLISPIIDLSTGAVYVLEPQSLNVELKSQNEEVEEVEEEVKTQKDRQSLVATPTPLSPTGEELPKIKGLGVSRYSIQSVFERVGFTFGDEFLVDGIPQVAGKVEGRMVSVQLIGPPEEVYRSFMTVVTQNSREDIAEFNGVMLLALIKYSIPTWEEGSEWFSDNLSRLRTEGEIETTYNHLVITSMFYRSMGMLTLSISPQGETINLF